MDRIGCDLCLDIHGSEGIPRVWGTLCTGWTPRLAGLCDEFLDGWARVAGPAFDRCEKRHFLSHLYIKMNIVPRQARDKHRENSKKSGVLCREFCNMETSVEETNLDVCTAQVGHRFGECIHHNGAAYCLPPFFCCLLSTAAGCCCATMANAATADLCYLRWRLLCVCFHYRTRMLSVSLFRLPGDHFGDAFQGSAG
eukprot:COSAG06_NODE_6311_length_2989_cov_8.844983_3_plen_197_part_00